jgi:hypothetical protein
MRYVVFTKDNQILTLSSFAVIEGRTPVQPIHHLGGVTYIQGRKEPDRFQGTVPMTKDIDLMGFWVADEDGKVFQCMASRQTFDGNGAHCSGVVMQSYVPENIAEVVAAVRSAMG